MATDSLQIEVIVPEELSNTRLDLALSQLIQDYSRSQLQSWIKQGFVTVNHSCIKQPRHKTQTGDHIKIDATIRAQQNWQGQALPINIIYEDSDIIIINKPTNCIVHPGAGNPDGTLVNALLHYAPELENVPRGGIVHRLDKDTTGLLVVARNLKAHHFLVNAIQSRTIKREYEAIVYGAIITGGTIEAPIGRHPRQRTKMSVRTDGKAARTHYRIIHKYPHFTHCRIILDTGRTHQIRVHMAHIHCPLIGDPVYASKSRVSKKWPEALQQCINKLQRQALHAVQLSLPHPTTNEMMTFNAPLPEDIKEILHLLQQLYS